MAKWRSSKKPTVVAGRGAPDGVGKEGEEKTKKREKGKGDHGAAAEVVISVPVHCDGCARKLRRSVQRLDGVEEVTVDCRSDTVVVRGRKAAQDAAGVVDVVERRTGKKALVVSSSPAKLPPSPPEKKGGEKTKKDVADKDMDKDLEMVVVMRIELHCEACSEEIKRRILKIKGVEEVVPHMKSSQVIVKGTVEPATLAGLIHKWTGRKTAIFRAEPLLQTQPPPPQTPPPPAKADEPPTMAAQEPEEETMQGDHRSDKVQEKKAGSEEIKKGSEEKKKEEVDENKGGGGEEGDAADDSKPSQMENQNAGSNNGGPEESQSTKDHRLRVHVPAAVAAMAPEREKMAMNSHYQSCYYYPSSAYPYAYPCHHYYQYPQQNSYAAGSYYPPAMYGGCYPPVPEAFSDENPNACSVM